MELVEALKNGLPTRLRDWLRDTRRELPRKFLAFDRVTDFSQLRKVTPHRRAFGKHRGQTIDRYYIGKFLVAYQAEIHGEVLEVQSADYTRKFGGSRVLRSEVLDFDTTNPQRTLTADLTRCPEIANASFDCFICTQTLHLIYDVPAAMREAHRLLKPGGVVLATLPGISQTCEPSLIGAAQDDFWRFTAASAHRLYATAFGADQVEVVTYGNVLSALGSLHGLITPELTPEELDYQDPEYPLIIGVCARKEAPSV